MIRTLQRASGGERDVRVRVSTVSDLGLAKAELEEEAPRKRALWA